MRFIDTHSHMYLPQFSDDLEEAVVRAVEKGVEKIILPNIDSKTIDLVDEMETAFPETCIPLMGLHPTHVKKDFEKELDTILNQLSSKSYIGIGEIGIDLYWDKTFFEEQKHVFETQVRYALNHKLPFIIHARESFNEIIEVLQKINEPKYRGVFHAFTGTVEQAREVIEMGFYIGLGGILTFKNGGLAEVADHIDLNHIVLETDSPYLAPTPFRGKRNESSYVLLIAEKLAEIKGVKLDIVAETTTRNAEQVFQL